MVGDGFDVTDELEDVALGEADDRTGAVDDAPALATDTPAPLHALRAGADTTTTPAPGTIENRDISGLSEVSVDEL